ncbi:hypothetical protein AHAT_40550 [Agarivorans sp. Toyoura001]|uniref:hypothetical protein n=1 Tax=Agarivorans sp. Toyoura001 TaxID=2283141 RepID=UPI0010ECBDB6|nr:hypothetical protein [Agarivorans sp. Toyoura001]GDY28165.1 hypothetical protein AHAT_40550 [Agarivorans sp. Toyoura001]
MFNSNASQLNTFDVTDVGFLERIVVGTTDPASMPTEEETQDKMTVLNRCLSEYPKGRIIGIERSFSVVRIGEHQVVLEAVVYHVGFKKAPLWLEENKQESSRFKVDPQKVNDIIHQY